MPKRGSSEHLTSPVDRNRRYKTNPEDRIAGMSPTQMRIRNSHSETSSQSRSRRRGRPETWRQEDVVEGPDPGGLEGSLRMKMVSKAEGGAYSPAHMDGKVSSLHHFLFE